VPSMRVMQALRRRPSKSASPRLATHACEQSRRSSCSSSAWLSRRDCLGKHVPPLTRSTATRPMNSLIPPRSIVERKTGSARQPMEHEADNRVAAEQLARIERIAHVGTWEWQRAADRLICSNEVYRILEVDAEQFRPRLAALRNLVHGDDLRTLRQWLIGLARGVALKGLDVRLLAAGASPRHVHLLGEALRDSTGRVTAVAGTIQDTTERFHVLQQVHRLAYFDV